jgi:hypothetical protein
LKDPEKARAWGVEVAAGEARLDWSEVEEVSAEALEILFGEADPGEHEGPLGLADLPEALAETYEQTFASAMEHAPERKPKLETTAWESSFEAEAPSLEPVEDPLKAQIQRVQSAMKKVPPLPTRKEEEDLREELLRLVSRDLMGPEGDVPEELEEDQLQSRYILGKLYPRGRPLDLEDLDDPAEDAASEDEDGAEESRPSQARGMRPSSLGLTVCLRGGARALKVRACWAVYRRCLKDKGDRGPRSSGTVWERRFVESEEREIPLSEGPLKGLTLHEDFPEVRVRGLIRKLGEDWIASLFLVNEQPAPQILQQAEDLPEEEATALDTQRSLERRQEDERTLHQVRLEVEGADDAQALRRRPVPGKLLEKDREERFDALRYRKFGEFAVGHGAAVEVLDAHPDGTRARAVRTSCFPRARVLLQKSPEIEEVEGASGLEIDMGALAETEQGQFSEKLLPLTRAYDLWIKERRRRLEGKEDDLGPHQQAGSEALAECQDALERIREGIALLDADPLAAECFRFANEAMRRQRIQSVRVACRIAGKEPPEKDPPARWRLFQLGFILLNLPSMARLDHPDRQLLGRADLLWFPTGGGKTEAYLGIAAFTMAMRRLRGPIEGRPGDRGVAVLMRYTLRLLTIQQFQRAATLICACEQIRLEKLQEGETRFGRERFTIGLWVGKRTTPNTTDQSFEAVQVLKGAYKATRSGSPVQLAHCPWCGEKIDAKTEAVKVMKPLGHTRLACGDATGACPFSYMAPGEPLDPTHLRSPWQHGGALRGGGGRACHLAGQGQGD